MIAQFICIYSSIYSIVSGKFGFFLKPDEKLKPMVVIASRFNFFSAAHD